MLSAPAGSRTFPALSLRIFLYVLESVPRLLLCCTYPFLHTEQRPSRSFQPVGAWLYPHCNFCVDGLSRLQLFVYLQARRFARHPDCSHRCISSSQGGRGFYVSAYLGLLPRRAGDMLTVRFGQLTVEGLSPSKIHSLAGCSENMTVRSILETAKRYLPLILSGSVQSGDIPQALRTA